MVDREHHLRHAVPLGLRSEGLHQKHHDQTTDDGYKNDQSAKRTGIGKLVGVVNGRKFSVVEKIVNDRDQISEENRANGCDDPDKESHKTQHGHRKYAFFARVWGPSPDSDGVSDGSTTDMAGQHFLAERATSGDLPEPKTAGLGDRDGDMALRLRPPLLKPEHMKIKGQAGFFNFDGEVTRFLRKMGP